MSNFSALFHRTNAKATRQSWSLKINRSSIRAGYQASISGVYEASADPLSAVYMSVERSESTDVEFDNELMMRWAVADAVVKGMVKQLPGSFVVLHLNYIDIK